MFAVALEKSFVRSNRLYIFLFVLSKVSITESRAASCLCFNAGAICLQVLLLRIILSQYRVVRFVFGIKYLPQHWQRLTLG